MADFLGYFRSRYYNLLDKRKDTFEAMFSKAIEFMDKYGKEANILETGSLRIENNFLGDGQSTILFDTFANFYNGKVLSVDIDPNCTYLVHKYCSSNTAFVKSDSVEFLKLISPSIDKFLIIYLDSFDFEESNPLESANHHLKELEAIYSNISKGTIIAVDDNFTPDHGKGMLVKKFLADRDIKPLVDGYQQIWVIE